MGCGKIESGKIEGGEMRVAYEMRLAKCGWQNGKWRNLESGKL